MPSRNILKTDLPHAYYHVYSRGNNKQVIFRCNQDYRVFLNLLKRYLSKEQASDNSGRPYPHLFGRLELLAYCLMPNHFHLLVYQLDPGAMATLMRSLVTSYSRYFNKTYARRGPLFESRYKASWITQDNYLQHISRYIHLNPKAWRDYTYSSLPFYLGNKQAEWLKPARVMELFEGEDYLSFVEDYTAHKQMIDELKHELANG